MTAKTASNATVLRSTLATCCSPAARDAVAVAVAVAAEAERPPAAARQPKVESGHRSARSPCASQKARP